MADPSICVVSGPVMLAAVRRAIAEAAQALRALPDGELVQLTIRANEFPVEAAAVQPRPARKPRPTEKLRAEIVERDAKAPKRDRPNAVSLDGIVLGVFETGLTTTREVSARLPNWRSALIVRSVSRLVRDGKLQLVSGGGKGNPGTYRVAGARQTGAKKPSPRPVKGSDEEEGATVKLSISSPMRTRPAAVRRVASDLPGVPIVHLPIVAAADVRTPLDRFLCVPYSAKITARTCIERQKAAGAQKAAGGAGSGRMTSERHRTITSGDYACCRDCTVGQSIAKRLAS